MVNAEGTRIRKVRVRGASVPRASVVVDAAVVVGSVDAPGPAGSEDSAEPGESVGSVGSVDVVEFVECDLLSPLKVSSSMEGTVESRAGGLRGAPPARREWAH